MLNYDRAVEICADYFEAALSSEKIEALTPFISEDRNRPVVVGAGSPPSANEVRKAPGVWVSTARNDKRAYEALIAAVKAMHKNSERLPRKVEEWLIALALNEIYPPNEPKSEKSYIIEGLVYHAVAAFIIKAGFHATRNSELGQDSKLVEKRCACDVVADAFLRYRQKSGSQLPSSYDHVRKIWQRVKAKYPFDEDEYSAFATHHQSGIWNMMDRAILNEEK